MTFAEEPCPGELGVHPGLAAGGAEAQGDPLEVAVTLDLAALGRERPGLVGEFLLADVAEVGAGADDQLDDAVEESRGPWGKRVALEELRLGTFLEDDEGAPVDLFAVAGVDLRELDRLGESHARGDVDEDPVGAPALGVAGDEDVADRDDRSSRSATSSGCFSAASASGITTTPSARALSGQAGDGARAAEDIERVELERGEVRELPALGLLAGELGLARQRGAFQHLSVSRSGPASASAPSANRALHLELDQPVHLDGVTPSREVTVRTSLLKLLLSSTGIS